MTRPTIDDELRGKITAAKEKVKESYRLRRAQEHIDKVARLREELRVKFGDRVDEPDFDPTDPYQTVSETYKKVRPKSGRRTADWMYDPALENKPRIGVVTHEEAVQIVARRMTDIAMHALEQTILTSKNETARMRAIEIALDRGWGKTSVMHTAPKKQPTEIQVVFGDSKGNKAGVQIKQPDQDDQNYMVVNDADDDSEE